MKKIRVGIVGLGAISDTHIKNIIKCKDAIIIGIFDISIERAIIASEKYQIPYVNELTQLIELSPDIVHVLTPHDTHYEIIKTLLEHKINVLAEKPLTIFYKQAIELVNIAAENGVILSVCLQNRTNKTIRKLIEFKDEKTYGKLLSVRGHVYWNRGLSYYQKDPWRGKIEHEGGGVLINQAIHTLDILTLLGGEIDYLYGTYENYFLPEIEVEDNATVTIKFKNQATAFLTATNSYSIDSPVDIEVVFEDARFKLIGDTLYQFIDHSLISVIQDAHSFGEKFYFGTSHENLIHNLYDYLLYQYGSYIDAKDTITSLEIINKVYSNNNRNQKITLDQKYWK